MFHVLGLYVQILHNMQSITAGRDLYYLDNNLSEVRARIYSHTRKYLFRQVGRSTSRRQLLQEILRRKNKVNLVVRVQSTSPNIL